MKRDRFVLTAIQCHRQYCWETSLHSHLKFLHISRAKALAVFLPGSFLKDLGITSNLHKDSPFLEQKADFFAVY